VVWAFDLRSAGPRALIPIKKEDPHGHFHGKIPPRSHLNGLRQAFIPGGHTFLPHQLRHGFSPHSSDNCNSTQTLLSPFQNDIRPPDSPRCDTRTSTVKFPGRRSFKEAVYLFLMGRSNRGLTGVLAISHGKLHVWMKSKVTPNTSMICASNRLVMPRRRSRSHFAAENSWSSTL